MAPFPSVDCLHFAEWPEYDTAPAFTSFWSPPVSILLRILLLCAAFGLPVRAEDLPSVDTQAASVSQFLRNGWDRAGVSAVERCSDERFVRRAYLDLSGRIPTAQEATTFLRDERPHKRLHLINLLTESEDYVQHFADVFDTLLMGRADNGKYQQRSQNQWRAWLERVFRDNRAWDECVQEVLLARPDSQDDRGVVWFLYERNNKHQEIAEAIAPAFFGIRIECAQCHDHMVAHEIEQAHYWGLVAFFNRGKNQNTRNGPRVSESAIGGFSEFANLEGSSSPNLLTFFRSPTIDEARPEGDAKQKDDESFYEPASLSGDPKIPKFSRRQKFVDEVVADHPLIARALVNRVWAMLMGRGIVHPFDEMDSVHPPSHPELLDFLADDFRRSGHNIRRLVRIIARNDGWHLDSRRPTGLDDPATFAWSLERPLTAEQYARSIQVAVNGKFRNDHPLVGQLRQQFREVLPDAAESTIKDALYLSNNAALNEFLASAEGDRDLIPRLEQLNGVAAAELLVSSCFGRSPNAEETEQLAAFLEGGTQDNKRQRLRQAVWAMLTSSEFRLNH